MTKVIFPCAFCGAPVELEGRAGRSAECPSCRRDIHCCLQCRFCDRSYHNQCRESQAGYISDREQSNFCEFFEFGRDAVSEKKKAMDSKNKLEELFKK
ncbi:MAG: hypothetical protein V2A66_02095 [Pseudomonadota bacterium]